MSKWLLWLLLIGLSLPAQERLALLIGNDAYDHWDKLEKKCEEVTMVAEELRRCGFALYKDKPWINVKNSRMKKLLEEFKMAVQSNNSKVVLFYYAGHGFEFAGDQYLVPVDMPKNIAGEMAKIREVLPDTSVDKLKKLALNNKAVSLKNRVEMIFDTSGNRANIFVVNACRDAFAGRGNKQDSPTLPDISGTFTIYATASGKQALGNLLFANEFCRNLRQKDMTLTRMVVNLKIAVAQGSDALRNNSEPQRVEYRDNLVGDLNKFIWGRRSFQIRLVDIPNKLQGPVLLRAHIEPEPEKVEFWVGRMIGNGIKDGPHWIYRWDSGQFKNGEYVLLATAIAGNEQSFSKPQKITIETPIRTYLPKQERIALVTGNSAYQIRTYLPKQERIALVIGNSAYQNRRVIKDAAAEVKEVAQELRRCGFAIYREQAWLDLTVQAMQELLDDFRRHVRQTSPQVVMVYYAGHAWEEDGEQYLVPVDMPDDKGIAAQISIARDAFGEEDLPNLKKNVLGQLLIALPLQVVPIFADPALALAVRPRVNILVVNACATNPFRRPLKMAGVFSFYAGGEEGTPARFGGEFCRNLRQRDMTLAKMAANLRSALGKSLFNADRLGEAGRGFIWGERNLQVSLAGIPQPVRGEVRLRARVVPEPERVEFVVAGKLLGRGQKSGEYWECKWDSRQVANGRYSLAVQAYRRSGDTGEERQKAVGEITVDNLRDIEITLDDHMAKPCWGEVFLTSKVAPQPDKVEYLLAGKLLGNARLQNGRWGYSWDSYAHRNGSYPLTVRAYRRGDGKQFSQIRELTIANPDPKELQPFIVNQRYYQAKLALTATIFSNGWLSNKQKDFEHSWSRPKLEDRRREIKWSSEKFEGMEVSLDGDVKVEGDALHLQANVCLQCGEERCPRFIQVDMDVLRKKVEEKLKLSGGHWCQFCFELKKWQRKEMSFLDMTSPEWQKLAEEKQRSLSGLYHSRYGERYGLPEQVWSRCGYQYAGRWLLDMTGEYWSNLSVDDQQHYAGQYQHGYAASVGQPVEKVFRKGGTAITMRLIPPGRFWMGSPENEEGRGGDEKRHRVVISQAYWLAKTEVTQGVWEKIMGKNPCEYDKGANRPVQNISWDKCQEFCRRTGLRLPSEAEWEYACRAGTTSKYYWGDSMDGCYAWYGDNSGYETHAVGEKEANAFGLYDMSGNVWEWCQDWYGRDYYSNGDNDTPTGPSTGSSRVNRGGSCRNGASFCRGAYRSCGSPGFCDDDLGLRVAAQCR